MALRRAASVMALETMSGEKSTTLETSGLTLSIHFSLPLSLGLVRKSENDNGGKD